jgi:AcrR family transcriptional regulator
VPGNRATMQVPNEQKLRQITDTAARLFATRPFHKVRLDDIAAAAGVGKGTLYVYFDSKEDLYFSLLYQGFARVVDGMKGRLADETLSAAQALRAVITELTDFAFRNPHFYELMRTVGKVSGRSESKWKQKRKELIDLLEQTIRRGAKARQLVDPRPDLTALCIPGLVRSIMLFGPRGLDQKSATDHIIRLIERGIVPRERS